MERKAHMVFAAGLSMEVLRLAGLLHPLTGLLGLGAAVIGSVVPDMDLQSGHRALMHNVFIAGLLSFLFYLLGYSVGGHMLGAVIGLGYAVGHYSHILLDSFTVRGVALLYPFTRKYYRVFRVKSDSKLANAVVGLIGALLLLDTVTLMHAGR